MKKRIPIGVSDFKELIKKNYYYADKSLMIKDVVEDGAKVVLLPRPRRFGKTLNMSMLKYFYENTEEDHTYLFDGLKIQKYEEIMKKQGKYPVIYLTFKDIKKDDFKGFFEVLKAIISREYGEHKYLIEKGFLEGEEKEYFNKILYKKGSLEDYELSLGYLTKFLYDYHKTKAIILIDEYDVPIQEGYLKDYYEKVIGCMRNLLSGGFKDNIYLEKAVLTGILRVAKESIFSGLNNLKVYSIISRKYSQYFGFLEKEVMGLMQHYELEGKLEDIKKWYNGYIFGENTIYNPWSILNYINEYDRGLIPYWINTSSNHLVNQLLSNGDEALKEDLESLVKGKEIVHIVDENIVMSDIDKNIENIWSFLLFSGYLKVVRKEVIEGDLFCDLKIPNLEIRYLYKKIIMSWFKESISNREMIVMFDNLVNGKVEGFERILKKCITSSASYFDIGKESEKFYHSFVLGMLVMLNNKYKIKSNRESGYGRYDIMMIPKNKEDLGIVIEFKKIDVKDGQNLAVLVDQALEQIDHKNYIQELIDEDIQSIMKLGIAFKGKEIMMKKEIIKK
ncbi:MAG: ATP-binding protein [Marinisporobacter sp.]|jgi:hypothetical protein|nr:ATP-binding protein [Marinisporobacter sp.]